MSVFILATCAPTNESIMEVLLTADASLDLRANPDMEAQGVAIEAHLDRGRGPVATVLVQRGTLRVGDSIVAGDAYGRVRRMVDEHGEDVAEAYDRAAIILRGRCAVTNFDFSEYGELLAQVERASPEERQAMGLRVLGNGFAPLLAQYARRGVPMSLRARVWRPARASDLLVFGAHGERVLFVKDPFHGEGEANWTERDGVRRTSERRRAQRGSHPGLRGQKLSTYIGTCSQILKRIHGQVAVM